jgi:hypothetical protein
MNLRFPVAMTPLITKAIQEMQVKGAKVHVAAAVFSRTAKRALDNTRLNAADEERVAVHRLITMGHGEGSNAALEIYANLADKGINVGGVYTQTHLIAMSNGRHEEVTISKVLVGKDSAGSLTKATEGKVRPWTSRDTMLPRQGTDFFVEGGMLKMYKTSTVGRYSAINDITKELDESQRRAVQSGLAANDRTERKLARKVAELHKESMEQQYQTVDTELETLRREAHEEGRSVNASADHQRQVPQGTHITIRCRDEMAPKGTSPKGVRIRITQLERFCRDAGIIECVEYMRSCDMIPPTFFADPEFVAEMILARIEASRGSASLDIPFPEGPSDQWGAPVIVLASLNEEAEYMNWNRFKNTVIKELWEDGDTILITFRVAQPTEYARASRILQARPGRQQLPQPQSNATPKRGREDGAEAPEVANQTAFSKLWDADEGAGEAMEGAEQDEAGDAPEPKRLLERVERAMDL